MEGKKCGVGKRAGDAMRCGSVPCIPCVPVTEKSIERVLANVAGHTVEAK